MTTSEMTSGQGYTTTRYAMYSVFRVAAPLGDTNREALASEVDALFAELRADDVVVRGTYDVAGLRADADLMIWWHSSDPDALQQAYHGFARTALGAHLEPVWSSMGVHRPAEFNRAHVPAFMVDEASERRYLCVYPFVRSYEWYLLPEQERAQMLRDHGLAARDYGDVKANTIAAFALGDYEWLLAFEADELTRIVDLMRDLRATDARRHVRDELPFYTGRALSMRELVALWA